MLRPPTRGDRGDAVTGLLVILGIAAPAAAWLTSQSLENAPGYRFTLQLAALIGGLTIILAALHRIRTKTQPARAVLFGRPPTPTAAGIPNLADRLDGHDLAVDRLERGQVALVADVAAVGQKVRTVDGKVDQLKALVEEFIADQRAQGT